MDEIFEINFISDGLHQNTGFYATFTITKMGEEGTEMGEEELQETTEGRV